MDSLRRFIQRTSLQFGGMTMASRIIIGSLAVVILMSLFVMALYSGRGQMTPLGLSSNANVRAVSHLQAQGISYEQRGTDILVPADQKYAILAQLTESRVIEGDQINFDTLVTENSPFLTRDQNRQRYLVAKMNVLANMISQMSNIDRASVVLDQPEGIPGIGRAHIPPSASVTALAAGNELSQFQVDAIARLVAGSHAGLQPEHVTIVDARTGRAIEPRTGNAAASGTYLEVKNAAEQHALATLQNALDYIAGVRISVNAQVDTKHVVRHTSSFEDPKIGLTSESIHESSSNEQYQGQEPGVRSNVGLSIVRSARPTLQQTDERTETTTIPAFPRTESHIQDSKGYALKINATIGVPKSYFVQLYRDRVGDVQAQPSMAALSELVTQESVRIQSDITPLIDTQALEGAVAGTVAVSMIPVFAERTAVGPSVTIPASTPVFSTVAPTERQNLARNIAYGGLGVLGLLILFMIIRSINSRPVNAHSVMSSKPPANMATSEFDLVGEADEAAPALEGLELDDEDLRRRQMLGQISEMVNRKPEDAAGVLWKWMKAKA